MRYERAILFDLDGTLTQSEEGIWNSVLEAADKIGCPRPDAETLRKFIGPPLLHSFTQLMGMSGEDAQKALVIYRERYNRIGLFENRVYPGIRRLLRLLRRRGWYLAVATGKPEAASLRILEHFGLLKYFHRVVGTGEAMTSDKNGLIASALPEAFDEAWIIGDRSYDINGGRANGIHTLGAAYGYGSRQELEEAGCDVCCDTVEDIIRFFVDEQNLPGVFLSMEGPDGSGKSTQAKLLREGLARWGYEVVASREPGGCPISEKIRALLLDPQNSEMADDTEALLYAAARAQHVRQVIRPTVAAGKLMMTDRFVDSSVAYQGGGRGLGIDRVLQINKAAVDGTWPDITVYLDIDHRKALQRRLQASEPDRLEREEISFHGRVEQAYHELIARDPQRFIRIDADRPQEVIAEELLRRVLERLSELEDA